MDYDKVRITKTILPELFELDASPLLPSPTRFSWEGLGSELAKILKVQKIEIQSDTPEFIQKTTFEYPHFTLAFHVGTIPDPVYVLIGKEEVENLARYLLGMKEKGFFEEGYLEGFKDFLVGMAIHTLEKQLHLDGWVLKASDVSEMSGGPYLEYGVKAIIDEKVFLDLIIALPKNFLEEWRSHYAQKGYQSIYQEAVQSLIELLLTLEIGSVNLHQEVFKDLKPGDFICLDRLTYLPGKKRGRAFICHEGHPLFLASAKPEGLKILEQTNYYQIGNGMAKEEEEYIEEETIEEEPEPEEPEEAHEEIPLEEQPLQPYSLTEGEVVIKVEIGRLKMTLDKLMKLEPGNILKLNTNLDNGVNLIVNDKMVGRGELVALGDLVGVRILNLGA